MATLSERTQMPLDPEAIDFLEQLKNSNMPSLDQLTPEEARKFVLPCRGELPEVGRTEDRSIEGPHGEFSVRVYWPKSNDENETFPAFVYIHGGGWVIGNVEGYDGLCRLICRETRCVVVSVEYHLAPEYRFPVAPEDCYTAVSWVVENAADLNVRDSQIAVGGDSAGGNLTAAVTLMAKDRGGPDICYQVLVYPITDYSVDTDSYRRNGEGYFLTTDVMQWFWEQYLEGESQAYEPIASPLRTADLSGLPPAMVLTAEYDPLRDEGIAYGKRLEEAGVAVSYVEELGMIHGYLRRIDVFQRATESAMKIAERLRAAFE
ncbi:MAG: lipase [Planctomycetaceae bacterium]|nr:lipase [Planctomycetaceae bacterium]